MVAHVSMADPFDKELSGIVAKAVGAEGVLEGDGVKLHDRGTVVCIGTYYSFSPASRPHCLQ